MGRIYVLGDAILDSYLDVRWRVYDDAIPGHAYEIVRQRDCPGGAANVAANLALLCDEVSLIAAIGSSALADRLQTVINWAGVSTDEGVFQTIEWSDQQLSRVSDQGAGLARHRIDSVGGWRSDDGMPPSFASSAPSYIETLVVADYGRLLVGEQSRNLLSRLIEQSALSVVDPSRATDWRWYSGANFVKVNESEFCKQFACSPKSVVSIAADFSSANKHDAVIVTKGSNGAIAVGPSGVLASVEALQAKDASNTSGAGDAFMAGFVSSYVHANEIQAAMSSGAEAAGRTVATDCTCPRSQCISEQGS